MDVDDESPPSEDEFLSNQERWERAGPPPVTREQFLEWRAPRRGAANPEVMTNPVWAWLVQSRFNAYLTNQAFEGPSPFSAGPGWCFERFGCSRTDHPDGRVVYVAGEHEDHYDPDFFIYNDVIVAHPGGRIEIYGYPTEIFPPTDFHSATLVSDRLILVGSLGYPEARRAGETQVLSLDLSSFAVSSIETTGDGPGWLHEHTATLAPDGDSILIEHGKLDRAGDAALVENIDDWRLHLADFRWERLTDRRWPRRELRRADGKSNRLWEFQQAAFSRTVAWTEELARQLQGLRDALGTEPDLDRFQQLFVPSVAHEPCPEREDEFGVTRILVDGIVVRFVNNGHLVQVTAEGSLPGALVDAIVDELRERLTMLEHTQWLVTSL